MDGAAQRTPGDRPARPARPPRFPAFDGLRAVAAISVLVYHVGFRTGSWSTPVVGPFIGRGDLGVTVFFLLSGFLLYRPFAAAHLAGAVPPAGRPYLLRRLLRIYPAYWFALAGVVLVLRTASFHDLRAAAASITLTFVYFHSSFARHGAEFVTPVSQGWSLCVEMSFYLFLPAWSWCVLRLSTARALDPPRRVRLEVFGLALLFAVGTLTEPLTVDSAHLSHVALWLWLPRYLDFFALGMLLAVLSAHPRAPLPILERVGRHPLACWVLALATLWVLASHPGLPRAAYLLGVQHATAAGALVSELLYGLTALLLLLPAVCGPPRRGVVRRFLQAPAVAWTGVVSYGIYLWHLDILDALLRHLDVGTIHDQRFTVVFVVVLALTLVAAAIGYYVVERPALRFKERFRGPRTGRHDPGPQPTAAT